MKTVCLTLNHLVKRCIQLNTKHNRIESSSTSILLLLLQPLMWSLWSLSSAIFNIPPQIDGGGINQKFGTMELKARSRERLGENISKVILAKNKTNLQLFMKDLLTSKMIINFKVFSPRVENGMCRQGNGRNIFAPDNRYMMKKDAKLLKQNAKPGQLSCNGG